MNFLSKLNFRNFLIPVIIGSIVVFFVYAFTGLSLNPPNGNPVFWLLSGTNMYYNSGNVGIGTSTPSQKLDVNGTIKATAYQGDGSALTGISGIPSGFVGFFNLSACPSGWTLATSADGRYIVGITSTTTKTLAGTDGTALSNLEDRPVGQHSLQLQQVVQVVIHIL